MSPSSYNIDTAPNFFIKKASENCVEMKLLKLTSFCDLRSEPQRDVMTM